MHCMHKTLSRVVASLSRMQSSIFSMHAFNLHCMQCKNYVYIFTSCLKADVILSNLIIKGNIKMKNLYEVINTESKNLQFARSNCLDAMQIAKELSKLDIIKFDVLKNGLRFATAYNGKIDIILPKQTFLEG